MKTAYINANIPYKNHDAFIVENDVFTHVGTKATILKKAIDTIVDLKHRTVLPGFNDSHMHLLGLGWQMSLLDAASVSSIEALIAAGREKTDAMILGRGFHEESMQEKRLLDKKDLNAISAVKPVIIYRACGHVLFANDVAIDAANQKAEIKAPQASYDLEKGIFKEDAMAHILNLIDNPTQDIIKAHILRAQAHLLKHGITAVGSDDFYIFKTLPFTRVLDAFIDLAKNDKLKLNVLEQVNLPDIKDLEAFVNTKHPHKRYGSYQLGPLKILADGSLGGRSAYMRQDYHDDPGNRGIEIFDKAALKKRIETARKVNMDFAIHAIGDQTIDTLIAIKEELKPTNHNHRDAIIHAQLADHDQIRRMKSAGLGAQTQPIFLNSDIPVIRAALGERARETYLFGSMIKAGVLTTISTDAPIEGVNPFENLYVATTRKSIKHPDHPAFLEEEAIPMKKAIEAYTSEPAKFFHREHDLGQIRRNHQADFIVVAAFDPANPNTCLEAKVLKTFIKGQAVYERDDVDAAN